MRSRCYISVILPLKLEWEPCYWTDEDVSTGDRVKVKFAGKEYYGVVSQTGVVPDIEPERILEASCAGSGMERILETEIELWRKLAEYYLCSIGEVYKAAYPSEKIKAEISMGKNAEAKTGKKRKAARKDVMTENGTDLGSTVCLSEAQQRAYDGIIEGFEHGKPVLLHGVTGSGKTEIYIRLAWKAINEGRNVLYLVPEIALSRQLEERMYRHFGERLLVFHSAETPASRRNSVETIRNMTAEKGGYVALCTRSGLLLPHHDLGLIIVDEEHDSSYKQESPAPRYNGRDTALILNSLHKGCNIILGSATPSLEEIYNTSAGRHVLVELKERYHGGTDAETEIIDTKAERRKNGMTGNFSRKLIDYIRRTLSEGGQTLILRSRRAWSPIMQCEKCGELSKCPRCNVTLSYHKDKGEMSCHYCGYSTGYTGECHRCGGQVKGIGAGTQKIEEEAAALFPEARIARLDSDTNQNKSYEKRIIREFGKGEIDILVGTQIITKGFDFGKLSLVAVISADSLLGIQDFRADEKALQILEQFRGRCGRRGDRGLIVIQTSQPEHPIFRSLAASDITAMTRHLLLERADFAFPPYTRIVEISIRDIYEDRAQRVASKLADLISCRSTSPVTGPYTPVVAKVADRHIRKIRISMNKDRNLSAGKKMIMNLIWKFETENKYIGHITINVDPL